MKKGKGELVTDSTEGGGEGKKKKRFDFAFEGG